MEEGSPVSLYIHLVPEGDDTPRESFKLSINSEQTVNDIVTAADQHLAKRNDGNKIFTVLSLANEIGAAEIDRSSSIKDHFSDKGDVFVTVKIEVDTTKTVQPVATKKVEETKTLAKEKDVGKLAGKV